MKENLGNNEKIRYYSLDAYKVIAALLIICLHGKLPDSVSGEVCALARMAVPFFFMVSGFFSYRSGYDEKSCKQKRIEKIIKYLIILVKVTLVYSSYYILLVILKRIDMTEFLSNFNLSFWLMHFNSISGHLWFVRALIYMELIFWLFEPIIAKPIGLYIALKLWIFDVIFIKYSNILFHMTIPEPYFEILTKFFGTAMVYYILGYQCKIYEKKIVSCFRKMNQGISILVGCMLFVLNLVEYRILTNTGMNQMPANYITTFLVSVYVFIWMIANGNVCRKRTFISRVGEMYSMYIYYWHLLVIFISGVFFRRAGISDYVYLNPLVVFIETLVVSAFFLEILKVIKNHLLK